MEYMVSKVSCDVQDRVWMGLWLGYFRTHYKRSDSYHGMCALHNIVFLVL